MIAVMGAGPMSEYLSVSFVENVLRSTRGDCAVHGIKWGYL